MGQATNKSLVVITVGNQHFRGKMYGPGKTFFEYHEHYSPEIKQKMKRWEYYRAQSLGFTKIYCPADVYDIHCLINDYRMGKYTFEDIVAYQTSMRWDYELFRNQQYIKDAKIRIHHSLEGLAPLSLEAKQEKALVAEYQKAIIKQVKASFPNARAVEVNKVVREATKGFVESRGLV